MRNTIIDSGPIIALFDKDDKYHYHKMMLKYSDIPMDLADSTLMYVAQKEDIKNIISIDSNFDIYTTIKEQSLNNLLRDKN